MYSNLQKYIPNRKPPLGTILNPHLKINKGIVGFWPMWEGSGNKILDLSGNENTGTFAAGAASPSWSAGQFGSALSFDGGDYIDCGNKNSVQIDSNFTIAGWFKTSSIGKCIISKAPDAVIWWYIGLETGANKLRGQFDDDDVGKVTLDSVTEGLNSNIWHHFAFTRDSGGYHVYIDGRYENTAANNNSIDNSANLYIGDTQGEVGASNWVGLLDNFPIYNRTLIASEVQQLYIEPFCGFRWASIEQLAAYYAVTVGMAGAMTTNAGYWGW